MSGSAIAVTIKAVDGTANTIDRINARMEAFNKRTEAQFNKVADPFRRLGRSVAKFSEVSGLNRVGSALGGIARAGQSAFQRVGQVVPLLGIIGSAASVAGITRMVTAWSAWGSKVEFSSQRIGVSAGRLSALQGAAQLAGSSAGGLDAGLQSLGQTMYDAIGGRAPEAIVMFRTLGIAFQDGAGHARSAADVLPELADKIKAMRDPFAQAQAATALFGSAAEDLLPFLRKGSAGIQEYIDAARRYGSISDASAAAANRLREAQARVSLATEGLRNRIAERLEPILTPLLSRFAEWIATSPQVAQGVGWLADHVQSLGDWIEHTDWHKFGEQVSAWLRPIQNVTDMIGGPQKAIEALLAVMAASFALKIIVPFFQLGWAVFRSGVAIGRLFAMIGGFTPPAWMAALGLAGGAIAGKLNTPMVDELGRPINDENGRQQNWGGGRGQENAESAAKARGSEPFVPLGTKIWRGLFGGGKDGKPGSTFAADPTLSPQARGLLDTIAGTESPGYNVEYGGARFSDYSQHPNVANPIKSGPNAGKVSTAAGRYQFLKSTWDEAAAALGLRDFSPQSQDKAAWWLAQRDYNRKTGRALTTDLKSTDPQVRAGIGAALHDTWTSLSGGIESGTNDSKFLRQLATNTARETLAVPKASAPPLLLGSQQVSGADDGKSTVRVEFGGQLPSGINMRLNNPQKVDVGGPLVERPQLLGANP